MAGGIETLNIVYLHQYFSTPKMNLGGIRSYEMAKRLVAWGHEVHVVTSDTSGTMIKAQNSNWVETDENGIHVHWLSVPYHNSMGFAQRVRAFFQFAAAAARKAASIDGDLVFATSTPLTIALPGIWAAKRRKRPMVFEVRDLWPEIPVAIGALKSKPAIKAAQWLERFSYRNSSAVVALSPGMRDGITKAGYPDDQITVIPNAADLDLFDVPEDAGLAFRRRYPWLQERPMVLYGGTFGLMNGVSYLPRLAAEVRPIDPDIRFVAVGGGAEKDMVMKTARELGVLDENFFIIERVNKEEMPAIHNAADIVTSLFIDLPEMRANSANKFFDGLASGTPLAINYGGWHADLLRDANAGLQLDPHDHTASARTLVKHMADRSWMEQAGKNARKLAVSQFARDDLARRLESVLTDVLKREAA